MADENGESHPQGEAKPDVKELLARLRRVDPKLSQRYRQIDSGDGMDGRNDDERRRTPRPPSPPARG